MVSTFLTKVACARQDVLQHAPGERARYATLGGVLIATATLAALSASFAVRMALHASLPLAAGIGFFWGLLILTLDRALVAGISPMSTWWTNVLAALPRFLIAIILGTVISTPVVLQIFAPEIAAEIPVLQAQRQQDFQKQQDTLYAEIASLERAAQASRKTIASGGVTVAVSQDPEVVAAQKVLSSAQARYEAAERAASCEAKGTCGTGNSGRGPVFRAKEQERRQAAAALRKAHSAVAATTADATKRIQKGAGAEVAFAKADLAQDEAWLKTLQADKATAEKAFLTRSRNSEGILARLEALDSLARNNLDVRLAREFLLALFLCIEILPVMLKLMLTLGPRSLSDKLAVIYDEANLSSNSDWAKRQISSSTIRLQASDAAVRDQEAQRRRLAEWANGEVLKIQAEVIAEQLQKWRQQVLADPRPGTTKPFHPPAAATTIDLTGAAGVNVANGANLPPVPPRPVPGPEPGGI